MLQRDWTAEEEVGRRRPSAQTQCRPHLYVDVGPVADEQLQAERPVAGGGGEVERGEALLVNLVDVGAALDELVHHHVLPVVAGHVQRGVTVRVGLVYLQTGRGRKGPGVTPRRGSSSTPRCAFRQ